MRVILSRKGFDGNSGKGDSPIIGGKYLVTLPIPEKNLTRRDISFNDKKVFPNYNKLRLPVYGNTYAKLMRDLGYKSYGLCHLDPDIDSGRLKKVPERWRPAFGQWGNVQKTLENKGVMGEDILFLFFGRFHSVKLENGKYCFEGPADTDDPYRVNSLHIIWGYLEVEKTVTEHGRILEYKHHPHAFYEKYQDKVFKEKAHHNALYIPRNKLSLDESLPGCGLLGFSKHRVLTLIKDGQNTVLSKWAINDAYISSDRKKQLSEKDGTVFYRGQWQELLLDDKDETERWAKDIIAGETVEMENN